MVIKQLIAPDVPVLSFEDTGDKALLIMEQHNIKQLPVIDKGKYTGLLFEDDILEWKNPLTKITKDIFVDFQPAVFSQGHPYEALRMINGQQIDILPVIDEHHNYLGAITQADIIKYIAENSGIDNPGGIIVIEMAARDYSLSALARICENEEVAVISLQMVNTQDGHIEITLKTNRNHLSGLASSFQRHDIHVKEVYGTGNDKDDIMNRYELLMNYLNM